MTVPEKPLRADAERNRQAIICAAGTVFAQRGTHVTLEHIAEVAGVGVGTIYRRFSSIDALVTVVLEAKMQQYADRTEHAAERAAAEPWEAFSEWVWFVLELQATDLSFSEVILSPDGRSEFFHTEMMRAYRASQKLVERARDARVLRSDFHHSDLLMLQHANAGVLRATRNSEPTAWRRFCDYMLQSFTAGQAPLSPPPSGWAKAAAAH